MKLNLLPALALLFSSSIGLADGSFVPCDEASVLPLGSVILTTYKHGLGPRVVYTPKGADVKVSITGQPADALTCSVTGVAFSRFLEEPTPTRDYCDRYDNPGKVTGEQRNGKLIIYIPFDPAILSKGNDSVTYRVRCEVNSGAKITQTLKVSVGINTR